MAASSGDEDIAVPRSAEESRWICVYPAYLNSKKTSAEGRKISKLKCVEKPNAQEIVDVLKAAGLNVRLERKFYVREPSKDMANQGRVRVQIKDSSGAVINEKFGSRRAVMLYAAEMIPKLKTRQQTKSSQAQSDEGAQAQSGKSKKGKK